MTSRVRRCFRTIKLWTQDSHEGSKTGCYPSLGPAKFQRRQVCHSVVWSLRNKKPPPPRLKLHYCTLYFIENIAWTTRSWFQIYCWTMVLPNTERTDNTSISRKCVDPKPTGCQETFLPTRLGCCYAETNRPYFRRVAYCKRERPCPFWVSP